MLDIFVKGIHFPVQWGVDLLAMLFVGDIRAGWMIIPPKLKSQKGSAQYSTGSKLYAPKALLIKYKYLSSS